MTGPKLTNMTHTHILPCKTFVSIGDCPFRNRCMYIHDMRIQCPQPLKTSRAKTRKNDPDTDLFYWPSMEGDSTSYVVPSDDPSMFSIWSHFVDFCQDCKQQYHHSHHGSHHKQQHHQHRKLSNSAADAELNQFTHQKRLPVFVKLAQTPSSPALPPQHPHQHHRSDEHERDKENRPFPQPVYKSSPQINGICRSSAAPAPAHASACGAAAAAAPWSSGSVNFFESPKSVDKTPHFESLWAPLPRSSQNC